MPIISSAITHVGTVRTNNEDAFLEHNDAGLWAIADGMGGHQAGDYASQHLIKYLCDACDRYKGNYLVERIRSIIDSAHRSIFQYSQQLPGQPVIGTTIVVLALEADNFHCFWSGDSRCYLLRNGKLSAITTDHSEAEAMLAAGDSLNHLSAQERKQAENTLIHAIGIDNETPYIDYVSGYIYESDRFFLCSDGINKVFTDDEVRLRLLQDDISKANLDFVNDALEAQAPDNLSSVIISIDTDD